MYLPSEEHRRRPVPAKSQKESAPKLCGDHSCRITKRIHPKIMWRQFPPNLKKNPLKKSVEAAPAKSQMDGGTDRLNNKKNLRKPLAQKIPSGFLTTLGNQNQGGSGQEKRDGISTYATLHLLPASLFTFSEHHGRPKYSGALCRVWQGRRWPQDVQIM